MPSYTSMILGRGTREPIINRYLVFGHATNVFVFLSESFKIFLRDSKKQLNIKLNLIDNYNVLDN